jgi:hypothetical protein
MTGQTGKVTTAGASTVAARRRQALAEILELPPARPGPISG